MAAGPRWRLVMASHKRCGIPSGRFYGRTNEGSGNFAQRRFGKFDRSPTSGSSAGVAWRRRHAQETERIAEIDLALVTLRQTQILDRADAFADEHRAPFGIEGAVAGEDHFLGAEEIEAAAQGC